jgi:pyridoxamine 5'-phosphate oxidase
MIEFIDLLKEKPYFKFKKIYNKALAANQKNIDAICIASYSAQNNYVDSRFVNLKSIHKNEFIFYTNYESPKAYQFKTHNQICVVIFWQNINTQIRIHANIRKIKTEESDDYFRKRSLKKNALSISSHQSQQIKSYQQVEDNYLNCINDKSLTIRPKYWGGYSFVPYYFEFWEGHESRLNKRDAFKLENDQWYHSFLQP